METKNEAKHEPNAIVTKKNAFDSAPKTVPANNDTAAKFVSKVGRKILVVVDMQNDFVYGSLKSKEAQMVEKRIVDKLMNHSDDYDAFYFTKDTHFFNYLDTLEGRKLPVKHCIVNTDGWQITPEIVKAIVELRKRHKYVHTYDKRTFSSANLATVLNATCRLDDVIEICGVCTDICVVANALSIRQVLPNNVIKVNPRLCAGTSKTAHEAAIKVMNSCMIDIDYGND